MEFNETQLIEYDKSIRPKMLNDYVGQDDIKEMLNIYIKTALKEKKH